ncbi:EmrB/QacA subfamily drug resistance transporter [Paraburkholderia tropica]|nr:EmrB/QacA subfamily drug resistance transporter [Paraburkholderia tropica]MBB3002086.1 EmrB/QacA subfamily drug resistance transporter [Paraburkholderia tropica]MBB6321469.1 EmrB/QacA subfamily drug resistance transporter [Paraburkholderia tropica]
MTSTHTPLPFRDALLAMLGIGLVNMLVALDQTVVSTALPSIVAELHGFEYYAWIASAYLLASVVTVPVFGRLGDYFGRKRFVLAAVIVFTVASVLCGLATDMPFLAAARALQGVGGGMMVGTAFASIPDLFPDPRARVRWQVVMAAAYGIGTAAGPSLGGWLSEHFGWRSTFMVNLPVGVLALYFIWAHLPNYRHARTGEVKIDWTGAALVAVVLGGFQTVIEGVPKDGFTTGNLALIALVAVGAVALLICERRATHPIIPLDLFRDPQLVTLFTLSVLSGFVMFSLIFFAPLLLQGGFGLSPQVAGLLATPIAACIALGSLVNTRIVIHLKKPTSILTVGFGLLVVASVGLAFATRTTAHLWLELSMGAVGIGLGFILNNLNVFGQEIAGRERFGITTALLQSTRMVGGMLGTSVVATIVNHRYAAGIGDALAVLGAPGAARWQPQLSDPRVLIDPALRDGLTTQMKAAGLDGAALIEAVRHVLVDAIHLGIGLTGLAALLAALCVRRISHIRFGKSATKAAPASSPAQPE